MTLKKEKKVWVSEVGTKNFFYPTDNFIVTEKEIEVQEMTWLSSKQELVALRVISGDRNVKNNTIVWVNKKDLS